MPRSGTTRPRLIEIAVIAALSAAFAYNSLDASTWTFGPTISPIAGVITSAVLSAAAAWWAWRTSRAAAYGFGLLMGACIGLLSLPSALFNETVRQLGPVPAGWPSALLAIAYFVGVLYILMFAAATAGSASADPSAGGHQARIPTWADWRHGAWQNIRDHPILTVTGVVGLVGIVSVLAVRLRGPDWHNWVPSALTALLRFAILFVGAYFAGGGAVRHGLQLGTLVRETAGSTSAFLAAVHRVLRVLRPVLAGYAAVVLLFALAYATVEKVHSG